MDEAEILNRIERKARKGKATARELRILAEAYYAHGISIPKDIKKYLG
jgi:DNA-binding MarR family transcriptional regulator